MARAIKALDQAVCLAIAVLYATIVAAMFGQVVFRYVLGSPLTWSEETARYLFVWLCFLGAYVAVVRNAHVGVDYLTRRFSPAARRRLNVGLSLLSVGALTLVAYEGLYLTVDNLRAEWATIPILSMGLAYLAVPIGAILMILGLLRASFAAATAELPAPGVEAGGL